MSLSKLQKLGYRYLEEGEHAPLHAETITSRRGKKLYRRFSFNHIVDDSKHKPNTNKEYIRDIQRQISLSNRTFEETNKIINNLFNNNSQGYPIVENTIILSENKSYIFINNITKDGLFKVLQENEDSVLVFFGDVLTDKEIFKEVMKIKVNDPNKILLTAFSGPYDKISYVFNQLPFEAKVGKFIVSPVSSKSGITFNPHKLSTDSIIMFNNKNNSISFKNIKTGTSNAK